MPYIYYAINRCVSIDDDNDVSDDDELAIEEKLRIDMLIVHGTPSSLLSPASRLLRCHYICPVVELLPIACMAKVCVYVHRS